MCGIIAYLGANAFLDYVLNGLELLQNRGYDSVGISAIVDCDLKTIKFTSSNNHNALEQLKTAVKIHPLQGTCGIGHTRWATHGGKTEANAHPHHDNNDRIALVHNGIIENFQELKNALKSKGYTFKSETDTEVIAVQIGYFLDLNYLVEEAIQHTVNLLQGTWALVIIHKDFPEKLWMTRNGSPLLLGLEGDFIMVASEQVAFSRYIKRYLILDNRDLLVISRAAEGFTYSTNMNRYDIKETFIDTFTAAPYEHWMLKEIMEQPASILRAMNNGGRILNGECVKLGGLDSCLPELLTVNHLILLGCGTSFHAGLWALNLFKSLHLMATIYDGAEFNCDDIPTGGRTALILLSQSGETKDLHRCIKIAKEMSVLTIGIVNVTDSLIARETDCGIYLNAGRECAVASTKSFTNQCIVLAMVAVWFSQIRNTAIEKRRQIIADLRQVSGTMQTFLDNSLGVDEKLKSVVDRIAGQHSLFILGKGRTEAIAKEGALKIKEVAYIHAEGYSSSALKHGPFALIVPHLPIIILDIHPEHRDKNNNVYYETTARGADVIIISTQEAYGEAGADVFHIPYNGTFSDLLANVYLQLISYYLGLKHGDPDYPRNLAKVVTVE